MAKHVHRRGAENAEITQMVAEVPGLRLGDEWAFIYR
jgi:hypothetical protein